MVKLPQLVGAFAASLLVITAGCAEDPIESATAAISSSFPSQVDPFTGNTIFQLTSATGNNSALYYHDNNYNGAQYLITRNLTGGDAASLTYKRIDLNTAAVFDLTPTGKTNGAFVRGNYLYAYSRPDLTGNYTKVSRYNIATGAVTDICSLSNGWQGIGDIAVNVDASALIYLEEWTGLGYRVAYKCVIATGVRTLLKQTFDPINHFQFHSTNNAWYAYINEAAPGLARVGVGRIDTLQESPLYTNDGFLNSFSFLHPFYATDGNFWSDAVWSGQTPQKYAVRFTLGLIPGTITGYTLVAIDNNEWQVHFNTGPNSTWFVGDGMGDQPMGEGFIHQLNLDPTSGLATQYRLADAVGTYEQDPWLQANAHYLPGQNLVVWSARRTLEGYSNPTTAQNVFAVIFPPTELTRYWGWLGHWASTAPPPAWFYYQATLGKLSQSQLAGQVPLYECQTASHNFLSWSSTCEGQTVLRLSGYINTTQVAGTVPLYRCYSAANSDHMMSLQSNCEAPGYVAELTLGFIKQ